MEQMQAEHWNDLIATSQQAEFPNEILVRFIARNFYGTPDRSRISILDIGSGAGANAEYLVGKGFEVTALDFSPAAHARLRGRLSRKKYYAGMARLTQETGDAANWNYPDNKFDCIIDINSLCHVERPPYYAIRDALKKHGKFFSIAPANDTWGGIADGKGYCRLATAEELGTLLMPFSGGLSIRKSSYPHGEHQITSWICEASK